MADKIPTLIRMQEWEVDERRRRLAELQRTLDDLEAQARRLEEEVLEEQAVARRSPEEAGVVYGAYAGAVILRRERMAKARAQIEELIATVREELREAYHEMKKYEVAHAARLRRETEERDHREQIVLDEVGLHLHRRRDS